MIDSVRLSSCERVGHSTRMSDNGWRAFFALTAQLNVRKRTSKTESSPSTSQRYLPFTDDKELIPTGRASKLLMRVHADRTEGQAFSAYVPDIKENHMNRLKLSMQVLTAMLLLGCGTQDGLLDPAQSTGLPNNRKAGGNLTIMSANTDRKEVTPSTDVWIAGLPSGFVESQDLLMRFNAWLAQQSSIRDLGYVASLDDAATRTVTLLWNGSNSVPAAVVQRAATDGITLKTEPWLLSYWQVQTAAQTLAALNRDFFGEFGFNLADVISIEPSFQGVSIEGTFSSSVTDLAAAAAQLTSRARALVGVPVRVITNVSTLPATGRDNDYSPFNAGGYMLSPGNGSTCSSGFAVGISGVTHTTTARHCIYTDYVARDAPDNQYALGSSTVVDPGAARYLGGAGLGHVWDGGWNQEGYHKKVVDYFDASIGDKVCTDGGNSGIHCEVQVTALGKWDDGYGPFDVIVARQQSSGKIAVIQGDSGGPVIFPLFCVGGFTGLCQVKAVGMIQAVSGYEATGPFCGSVHDVGPDAAPNICGDTVFFSSMRTIVNGIPGGSLVHG